MRLPLEFGELPGSEVAEASGEVPVSVGAGRVARRPARRVEQSEAVAEHPGVSGSS